LKRPSILAHALMSAGTCTSAHATFAYAGIAAHLGNLAQRYCRP
jgi:hypothetical protein